MFNVVAGIRMLSQLLLFQMFDQFDYLTFANVLRVGIYFAYFSIIMKKVTLFLSTQNYITGTLCETTSYVLSTVILPLDNIRLFPHAMIILFYKIGNLYLDTAFLRLQKFLVKWSVIHVRLQNAVSEGLPYKSNSMAVIDSQS